MCPVTDEKSESTKQETPLSDSKDSKKAFTRNWQGKWPKTPGRLFGLGLIRFYQLTLSSYIGNSCRHQPTCSEYGYEAIARHGFFRGGRLTLWRVAKCNPFGTSGYDPVPKDKK
ncbi:MAG: membrane protein insertion efficiency factor YidD [Rhizobiaceae bacterium]|nr:membrane protein insertion efficiency factor YidD [Rhizobiaceae bacterium]